MTEYVVPYTELGMHDIERVGGKNASLGEMISHLSRLGVSVPAGFATTADAYREFLAQDGLAQRIDAELSRLNVEDVAQLARTGDKIRNWVLATPFPSPLERQLVEAWRQLGGDAIAVAVRSSATAEDLPDASFAGQQETFLNVRGKQDLLRATHLVFASLFNDRAIAYRVHQGFAHSQVALSAGVQLMVRSDLGASGVMFTLDTESGFRDVVFITASYGLGETVVQGAVNPDEFYVYKPALRSGHLSPIVRRGRVTARPSRTDLRRRRRCRAGWSTRTRGGRSGRTRALLHQRCRRDYASAPGAHHRGALWPADGHRVGSRRRQRQDLYSAGTS